MFVFRKRLIARLSLLFLVNILINSVGHASSSNYPTNTKNTFWDRSAEGYWWYAEEEEPIVEPLKKEEKKKEVQIAVHKEEPKKEETKKEEKSTSEPLQPFSRAWVKKNLDVYLENAWNNPTPENVRAYLYLQRFAIDRSESFAYAGQMAIEGDPLLDEAARAPTGGAMAVARNTYINAEQRHLLEKIYEKAGIFFVFKNNCYLCDEQAKLLKTATKTMDISIRAVSVDEPNENSVTAKLFPNYIVNPNIINSLQIRALPASFFIDYKGEIKPLLQGFVTLSDLNRRVINAARKYDWLPKEDFDYVKPFDDVTSLSSLLDDKSSAMDSLMQLKEPTNPFGEDTTYIAPDKLIRWINEQKDKSISESFVPRGY